MSLPGCRRSLWHDGIGRAGSLFRYVDLEARVRGDHRLCVIRENANAALIDLSRAFTNTDFGRPSIAPERLLRAMLLQAFYGIRSERQLMERLEFDLLFWWFVGLVASVCQPSTLRRLVWPEASKAQRSEPRG
jgi:transposase